MANPIDRAFGNHDEALVLRARRSSVLASNLANADTPNYKARDLDFGDALSVSQKEMSVRMNRTDSRHLSLQDSRLNPGVKTLYRVPDQASLDGNTVDTQREQARFTENALQYQTTLQFLNSKITGLKNAFKGE